MEMKVESTPQSEPAVPGIGQAVGLLSIFIGLQSLLTIPFFAISFWRRHALDVPVAGLLAASALALGATVWLGTLICKVPRRRLVCLDPLSWRLLPAVLLLCAGSFVLSSEVENLTRFLLPMSAGLAMQMEALLDVRGHPFAAGLLLVVMAPVSEEIICRRWVLGGLLHRFSPPTAILVSALIFGAMHMNPWQFFYAVLLGMVLGFLYWRTRSTMLCILAHGLNNATSYVLGLVQPDFPGMAGNFSEPVEFQPPWLDAVALLGLLTGAIWVWRLTRASSVTPPTGSVGPPPVIPADGLSVR